MTKKTTKTKSKRALTDSATQTMRRRAAKIDLRYVPGGCVPRNVRDGRLLVHNFVPTEEQATAIGYGGFRAFTVLESTRRDWRRCYCGFAPDVERHYTNATRGTMPRGKRGRFAGDKRLKTDRD